MENFTLQDAMSALEVRGLSLSALSTSADNDSFAQIGEPRLDTGLIVQEQLRPPFNPLTPLLPEELCWILDRSLIYEVCRSNPPYE